ncbi:MAG: hypothetical protein M3O36_13795 [Myxococcota bacterium]|nr:hypothetical protein [Myxococcota bacterium]
MGLGDTLGPPDRLRRLLYKDALNVVARFVFGTKPNVPDYITGAAEPPDRQEAERPPGQPAGRRV